MFDSYVKLPWGTKNSELICLRIGDASFSLFDRPTQNIGVVMNAIYIHMYVCIYIHMYVCMYVCMYLSIYLSI